MIYPIVVYGNPVLKKPASDIEKGSIDIQKLADDMFETMHSASGVGLAAPQIGKSIRLFIVDGSPMEEEDMVDFKKIFVNPEIIEEYGDDWVFEEGCLSIPDYTTIVKRAAKVTVRGLDRKGEPVELERDGLLARAFQHEIDHLDGVLFVDRIGRIKKGFFKKRYAREKIANKS